MSDEKKELIGQLLILEQEHRDLDEVIHQIQEKKTVDLSQIQRLKKRKLGIKDRIATMMVIRIMLRYWDRFDNLKPQGRSVGFRYRPKRV